jgi:hypothetical protein
MCAKNRGLYNICKRSKHRILEIERERVSDVNMIQVTPDGQRTMRTSLGAAAGLVGVEQLPVSSPLWKLCPIQAILLSYLVSDTRVSYFFVYMSSNQPDVAGMM